MDKFASVIQDADPLSSWWPFIIAFVVGLVMTIRTVMGGQKCPTSNLIDEQVVVVTGGSGGIGLELCKALYVRSACVIMACRNMEKAEKLATTIREEVGAAKTGKGCNLQVRYLDLKSFDSVKRFSKGILKDFDRLDILINNAGIIFHPNEKTVDGFELHLQVNYLAPVLLTHLLLPHLKKSPNGRIINVSAHAHVSGRITHEDPLNVGTWANIHHPREAFAHSKLALIMFTKHLARLLKDETNITVNACTPGLVRGTGHLRSSPLMSALCVKAITYPWMWLFMKNPVEGAQCLIYLATDPKLQSVTGEYFNDCEVVPSSEPSNNKQLIQTLFLETIKLLQISNFGQKNN